MYESKLVQKISAEPRITCYDNCTNACHLNCSSACDGGCKEGCRSTCSAYCAEKCSYQVGIEAVG